MSGLTVHPVYREKWGWLLLWGDETFYDENRYLRTWKTKEEAVAWVREYHPRLRVVDYQEKNAKQMEFL